jgi:hypothetical protein
VVAYVGDERHDPERGYYDADRIDGNYTYYPTREELYIHEVFERIIDYTREKFVKGNALYFHYLGDYSTSSTIAPIRDYERGEARFPSGSFCLCYNGQSDMDDGESRYVRYPLFVGER